MGLEGSFVNPTPVRPSSVNHSPSGTIREFGRLPRMERAAACPQGFNWGSYPRPPRPPPHSQTGMIHSWSLHCVDWIPSVRSAHISVLILVWCFGSWRSFSLRNENFRAHFSCLKPPNEEKWHAQNFSLNCRLASDEELDAITLSEEHRCLWILGQGSADAAESGFLLQD